MAVLAMGIEVLAVADFNLILSNFTSSPYFELSPVEDCSYHLYILSLNIHN